MRRRIGGDFHIAAVAAARSAGRGDLPAKLVVASDHTATVPPSPEAVALAFSVEAKSIVVV